ncbi:MAG: hypothetical protein QOF76_732 [Solirubrobacteraceae bacterium]|jgi:AhpD family alkylhydroperoxidase|nr:hypothetical protein [Solirubrobacteraceae bacterium]
MSNATIQARMANPAMTTRGAMPALLSLHKSAMRSGLPESTAYLVHLRASQINACAVCTEMHAREMKEAGDADERIWSVAAWREAPYFTDAERAALALTEALTRIADRPEAVSDEIYDEAAEHFDEEQLSALIIEIASINVWNRLNLATRQPAGQSWS